MPAERLLHFTDAVNIEGNHVEIEIIVECVCNGLSVALAQRGNWVKMFAPGGPRQPWWRDVRLRPGSTGLGQCPL